MLNIKEYVQQWKNILKEKIAKLARKPKLIIVQLGDVEASNRYVRNKIKDAEEVGIEAALVKMTGNEFHGEDDLRDFVGRLAEHCDGIIVQLPLPEQFKDVKHILEKVPAHKDVDGLSGKPGAQTPCTPLGIMKFINDTNLVDKTYKKALVIGRSELVGRPMAKLLLDNDYTVTVCHSKSGELAIRHLAEDWADLVVCAVGRRNFLDCTDIDVPVIDVGINFDENGKLCGDCYVRHEKQNDLRSPVPGGVGLLTRCALLENTVRSYEAEMERNNDEITIREPEQKD